MKKTQKGFTLIELLVVIAIIGILSAIVLASLSSARSKGKDAAVEAQLSNMRAQGELFYSTTGNNTYTAACTTAASSNGLAGLVSATASSTAITVTTNTTAATAGTYNTVTCHDSATAWAAEAPMSTSASGSAKMWCVDSTGASKSETTNLGSSVYACS